MRLKEYSLSKAPYLIINLLIYLLVFILFRIADVSYKELAVIFLIWFLPMITYFLIEFFVKRRFYMEVYDVMKKLAESSDNAEETTTTKSSDTTSLIIIVNLLFIAVATVIIVLFNNKNKLEIMDKLEEMDSVKKTKKGAKNEA